MATGRGGGGGGGGGHFRDYILPLSLSGIPLVNAALAPSRKGPRERERARDQ